LILRTFMKKSTEKVSGEGMLVTVPDMSCEHCKRTLDTAIRGVTGVNNVNIDLKTKQIEIVGSAEENSIFLAIQDAGYTAKKAKQ
jgi:copper chaperone